VKMTLTQSIVDSGLQCPEGKRKIEIADSDGVKGLFIEARSGCDFQTFYYRFRDRERKTRLIRLGHTSTMSLADARKEARTRKARLTLGDDLQAERTARAAVPLYRDFFKNTYEPYISLRKRSCARDRQHFELRLEPAMGHLRLDQITLKLAHDVHDNAVRAGLSKSSANGTLRILRHSLNLGIQWGLYAGPNVCSKFPLFHEDNVVDNVPNDEELDRLLEVLRNDPNRLVADLAIVALNSAMRLSELLQLRWSDCDLENGVISIQATNTKTRKRRLCPANSVVAEVLKRQRTFQVHEYVFVNRKTNAPYTAVFKAWDRIRKRAGLPRLRLHDLRHSALSYAARGGADIVTLAAWAGHQSFRTTARYLHAAPAALASAANVVSMKTGGRGANGDSKPTT